MAVKQHRPRRWQVEPLKERHLCATKSRAYCYFSTGFWKHSLSNLQQSLSQQMAVALGLTMELLPPPLGPTSATVSPGRMSRLSPLRTCTAGLLGYEKVTPRSASAPLISAGTEEPESGICVRAAHQIESLVREQERPRPNSAGGNRVETTYRWLGHGCKCAYINQGDRAPMRHLLLAEHQANDLVRGACRHRMRMSANAAESMVLRSLRYGSSRQKGLRCSHLLLRSCR